MIGIWYVPKKNKFYSKYVKTAYFHRYYKVGYVNQYGHELVALFVLKNKKLIQVDSLMDYYTIKKSRICVKNMIIDHLIGLLNKMKKGV